MGFFTGKSKDEDSKLKNVDNESKIVDDRKLLLRKEELDIAKDKVKIGEVELSKEIVEEHKVVDVPVTHEEVVIERKALDNEVSGELIGEEESIHIPVSEERVEVGKHTVLTGEVSAYKREVKDTKRIEETLKREEARVHTDGDANIVENETNPNLH